MNKKIGIVIVIAALVAAFFAFDLGQYLSLEYFQAQQEAIQLYYQENPVTTGLIYFVIYMVVFALALPAGAILSLAGGAIFGLFWGTVLVSFASSIGSTISFLISRLLLRDWVQQKFGSKLKSINEGVEKEGAFYLFTLRMVPAFAPAVINLTMGLTKMKVVTFYIVSQLGMLLGTMVYIYAGTQFGKPLDSIVTPELLFAFALLGIFPLVAKKIVDGIKARKILKGYDKPKQFDTNMVVIGAGSGGLVSALIAATVKAKVTLIEKHKMGGDCLNTGCVPSKALIRSAKINSYIGRATEFGINNASGEVDFPAVMERIQGIIKKIEPHDSVERYTGLGVDCVQGEAKILSPYEVEVNGEVITTRNIVIATGARPFVPPIKGIEEVGYLTSDNVWDIREQPKQLLVIGGGPIGSEMAQAFHRLGCNVTQLDLAPRIMPREDEEVSAYVAAKFEREGIKIAVDHVPQEFKQENGQKYLLAEHQGETVRIDFDQVIVAVGRKANVEGFGLEELGVALTPQGTVATDEYLRTNFPNIYAVGDVAGPYQFTHTASHMAWYAAVNSLFGKFRKFKVDYSVIPWATFTDPEVARVGLSEAEAKEKGIEYEVTRYDIDDLDRAMADSEDHGFIKVLTVPGKDKILGATIVGYHAGELITEYIMAMKHGLGLNKIMGTIHIYPTLSESNKFVAGEWKKARKPEKLLGYVERFHTYMRS